MARAAGPAPEPAQPIGLATALFSLRGRLNKRSHLLLLIPVFALMIPALLVFMSHNQALPGWTVNAALVLIMLSYWMLFVLVTRRINDSGGLTLMPALFFIGAGFAQAFGSASLGIILPFVLASLPSEPKSNRHGPPVRIAGFAGFATTPRPPWSLARALLLVFAILYCGLVGYANAVELLVRNPVIPPPGGLIAPVHEVIGLRHYEQATELLQQAETADATVKPQREEQALKHLRAGVGYGAMAAAYSLAVIHAKGERVPADSAEAERYMRLAAQTGHGQAEEGLARILISFDQTPERLQEAVGLLRSAAAKDRPEAARLLQALRDAGQIE